MIKETPLCKLAFRYGADKCPKIGHAYTPFYYELLKDKQHVFKKVLEVGVGGYRQRKFIPNYTIGASLYMWRDFFPEAQIYGGDISPESIFKDERVTTYYCNENREEDIVKLIETIGSDIDFVVDDANHSMNSQKYLCLHLMPLIKKDVLYVIEDCGHSRMLAKQLTELGYESYRPELPENPNRGQRDNLIVVKNKQ